MEQFTFSRGERTFTLGLILLGVVCLGANFLTAHDAYDMGRFWTNILHNSVFFTGIAFLSIMLLAAHNTATSGWHTVFRRAMEAMASFIPVGGVLMLIIALGIMFGWHDLYHWAAEGITDPDSANYDKLIAGKSGFLNTGMYIGFTVAMILLWMFFLRQIRSFSLKQDTDPSIKNYKRGKFWSAIFLPIGGVTSCTATWFWVMSLEPHWYSTLYAWYGLASWLVSAVAFLMVLLYYLKDRGYYKGVLDTHIHDIGKYVFGFSVFWTYLWFSQYMLIWYGNNGEETIHFQIQLQEYPVLFYAILIMNFVIPFLIFIRNDNKWKKGAVMIICGIVFFGHWLDYYLMVKPGVLTELRHHEAHGADHGDAHGVEEAAHHGAEHAGEAAHHGAEHGEHAVEMLAGWNYPGLLEIGIFLGFLGLFLFVLFTTLSKVPLVPGMNDPMMEESLSHQGGPLGPEIDHHHHH